MLHVLFANPDNKIKFIYEKGREVAKRNFHVKSLDPTGITHMVGEKEISNMWLEDGNLVDPPTVWLAMHHL